MGTVASPAIRISGLVKDYGHVRAVAGIDLEVECGEVFGFVGPNGAGKTTTIRCLLDVLRPTAGRIEILGLDPRRDGPALRALLAYVPGDAPGGRHRVRAAGRQVGLTRTRLADAGLVGCPLWTRFGPRR